MRSVTPFVAAALLVLVPQSGWAGPLVSPLVNGDFADGLAGWADVSYVLGNFTLCFYNPRNNLNCNYQDFVALAGDPVPGDNGVETEQVSMFDPAPLEPPGPPVYSPSGDQFAYIDNLFGPGQRMGGGSSLSQTFVSSPRASGLTFNLDYLSFESPGDGFDYGGAALVDDTTNTLLDEVDFNVVGLNPPTEVRGPVGGGFNWTTGWINEYFPFAGSSGDTLTLTFYVQNTPDTLGESRLLIDDVDEVPEPPSAWMMVLGLVGFLAWRNRVALKLDRCRIWQPYCCARGAWPCLRTRQPVCGESNFAS